MAWVTPKTNWVGTDRFYAADWKRIVGNVKYLADEMSSPYTPLDLVADGDVITSDERNDVTEMIETIFDAVAPSWDLPYIAPRTDYGSSWNSSDLNKIEKTLEDLKEEIEA